MSFLRFAFLVAISGGSVRGISQATQPMKTPEIVVLVSVAAVVGIATGVIKVRVSWTSSPWPAAKKPVVSKYGLALPNLTIMCGEYSAPDEMWWRLENQVAIHRVCSLLHSVKMQIRTQDSIKTLDRLFPAVATMMVTKTTALTAFRWTLTSRTSNAYTISWRQTSREFQPSTHS